METDAANLNAYVRKTLMAAIPCAVFLEDRGRRRYLSMLADYGERYGLEVLVVPPDGQPRSLHRRAADPEALSRTFRDTHRA